MGYYKNLAIEIEEKALNVEKTLNVDEKKTKVRDMKIVEIENKRFELKTR